MIGNARGDSEGEISIDQVKDHDLEWKGENSEGEISIDQVNGHDLELRGRIRRRDLSKNAI